MPNAAASPAKPVIINLTLHAPSPAQVNLLLPVTEDYLRTLYVRHGEKKLNFWEKQSLFRNKRNFLRKGLLTLLGDLKSNPQNTFHARLTKYLENLSVNRRSRHLKMERLALLATTTEATLLELANLAADRADETAPKKGRPT